MQQFGFGAGAFQGHFFERKALLQATIDRLSFGFRREQELAQKQPLVEQHESVLRLVLADIDLVVYDVPVEGLDNGLLLVPLEHAANVVPLVEARLQPCRGQQLGFEDGGEKGMLAGSYVL